MPFQDHFSGHAADYAAARPTYPPALYAWLAAQCGARTSVWDAGCGNGQAAVALAAYFDHVTATDPSAAQIAQATPHPRVTYRVEAAERCTLAARSVDLVTVAQALHWFDLDAFHAQTRRVLKPGGVIAEWCYGLSRVTPAVDNVFAQLHDSTLRPYWPPERRHIETGYRTLAFPFAVLTPIPTFEMRSDWTLPQYLAYLRSWSASQRHLHASGRDAVDAATPDFTRAWGDPAQRRAVCWPLALRAGRCTGAGD